MQLFAKAVLDTFDLKEFSIDREKALIGLKDDISSEFEDLNSEETKKARNDHFKIEGAKPEDYFEKVLLLDSGRKVIYGIRHMGGNPDLPFVQLTPNYQIYSKAEALEVYEKVRHEFEVFKPKFLSFWSRDQIDADFFGSIYMVSTSKKMKLLDEWSLESDLTFTKITDDSYYDWYESGYKEFHESSPELSQKVTVNSVDSMRDSLEEGLLFYVEFQGERIGLIAGERSKLLGHDGIYFHEIFISKKWKGKGLAKAIQRKFIVSNTVEHELVWGTIDAHNLPSFKTAKSNGRRPMRYECFVDLPLGDSND
ncbi:hypothetical protein M900_1451 [Bacteriovorax sp. Seq25_V]|nr:hypothetical protein M900_1451 [Bacteriovorax sp. Seq25_V]